MKRLYLLRHAHTDPAAPPLIGDHERLLSVEGKKEAETLGDFMRDERIFPQLVLSSTAVRTTQTARIIAAKLSVVYELKVGFEGDLYLASADRLLEKINQVDSTVPSLMVVAHNPGISQLAHMLSNGSLSDHVTDYVPGTLSFFTIDVKNWIDFLPAAARLESVFVPGAKKSSADRRQFSVVSSTGS